jgi:prolyl 4-hydroxylase
MISCWFHAAAALCNSHTLAISTLAPDKSVLLGCKVLHYGTGQHYHVHHDYFEPSMYPGDKRWASGHNRMITVFFYLTDVEEGGQTVFPHALPEDVYAHSKDSIRSNGPCEAVSKDAIRIPAVKGNAIIFYGMHPK